MPLCEAARLAGFDRSNLGGLMKVKRFLKRHERPVLTVRANETLADTALKFAEPVEGRKYSVAVVTDDDERVVGVVSLGDLTYALGQHRAQSAEMLVGQVMTAEVAAAHVGDDINDLLKTMAERDIRHMPVIEEDGRLLGLVARRDALEFLADEEALEMEQLRGFVFRSGARY